MSNRADRFRNLLSAFVPICLAVALCVVFSGEVLAAEAGGEGTPVIMVLPFQMNAGQELDRLPADFPAAVVRSLESRGLKVVPMSTVEKLIQKRGVTGLDLAGVRSLAKAAGATHAVYGAISELGDTISIDSRLVPVAGTSAKPLFVEQRAGGGTLAPAADDLAGRVSAEFSARRGTVAGVEVRGTKVLDPDVVLMRINTRKGDQLDSAAVDQEVKRIWDLGWFSDVKVDVENRPDGLYLVYTVVEKPRIENIVVEGTDALDEDDVLELMGTKAGSVLNEKLLAEDKQKIIEQYRTKGYYLAKVDTRVDMRQGGSSSSLVVAIDEGKKLYIKKVVVDGAKEMSESDVKGEMMLSERGIISWITGSGVLKEELLERDAAAISSFYLNHGFLDITVGAAKIDYDEDGITVTFPISEGPRYKLGNVTFAGDLIEPEPTLLNLTKLDEMAQDGEYFKLQTMQEDSRKVTDFYADYGYAFADVNPRPQKRDDGGPVVDVIYTVNKGNKVYVRRVLVEGNNKTRDNVILREMRVTDSEAFEGSKLRRSTERLNKLGYFEVAEAELVPTENPDEVDLKVKVKERPTGALMGGVGYSTFSNFGVTGTIMERNLWGKGYNVSLQAGFSGRREALTFSFTNPRWNDTDLSVGFDIYHWRDDYIDYRKKTTGSVVRMAYPLGEYTSLGWGYRLDQYSLYDLEDNASWIIRKYADGDRISSVGMARITRDTTNKERPTNGNIDRIGVEYGGGVLGGDDDFFTVSAEHQTYFELMQDHVLHMRVKGSAIFENGSDEVPVFERFWMGGIDSVRGYDSRDIVPTDPATGDRIGGTRMAFANFEYIWSVSNEFGLNLVPFFDVGLNVDDDRDWNWDDELKRSAGLELRWRSPMGDLRFSYGIPFDENRDGEKDSGRFEFSMGQFF